MNELEPLHYEGSELPPIPSYDLKELATISEVEIEPLPEIEPLVTPDVKELETSPLAPLAPQEIPELPETSSLEMTERSTDYPVRGELVVPELPEVRPLDISDLPEPTSVAPLTEYQVDSVEVPSLPEVSPLEVPSTPSLDSPPYQSEGLQGEFTPTEYEQTEALGPLLSKLTAAIESLGGTTASRPIGPTYRKW